jgi:Ca2+-binding EF-hand superfamily protein
VVALVWDIDRAGMATTGESKHVVILMDRSWEPALRPAVEMVHDILITIVRLQDQVGVATTGGEWLVDLGPKAGRQAHLIKKVAAASELSAGIALDHSILLCLEVLATAARSEEASQWLLVFSDGHGGDLDSAEATAGRESLSSSEVNIIFVNMRHFSGFYPVRDQRWEAADRDIGAYIEAANGRGHELQLRSKTACELSERKQVTEFLTRMIPYATTNQEESTEHRRHREHALVLHELRHAMDTHSQDNGNCRQSTEHIFAELDTDGSGTLDPRELKTAMRKIGVSLNATQVEHLVAALDRNGDGIDHNELAEFLHGPDSRAEQIAKARRQAEHRKVVEEARTRRKLEEEQQKLVEQHHQAVEKQKAERLAAQFKAEEKLRQEGLATMDKYGQRPSFGGVPSMRARLETVGATLGRINCSLHWQNEAQESGLSGGADLNLHVRPPRDSEISLTNKEAGGGVLDVEMGDDDENPVENIFFENPRTGHYTVRVSCRNDGLVPKNFECSVLVAIPGRVLLKSILQGVSLNQIEGEEFMEGATMISGTVYGIGHLHAVTVCEFDVLAPEPDPVGEPDSPNPMQQLTVSRDTKGTLGGKELQSSFRDKDEVMEAMTRLSIPTSTRHALLLGIGDNQARRRMRGLSMVRMGFSSAKTQARQKVHPYRIALREMSERVAAQRQGALLTERREADIRQASSPRVSGLPRGNAQMVRDRILNGLAMPHPRWSSREGRPRTVVLQQTSISCWESGWGPETSQVDAGMSSTRSDSGSSNYKHLLPTRASGTMSHHPARNDADAIFERVRMHVTKDNIRGWRPHSSPRRRQQDSNQQEMFRGRAQSATQNWPVSSLPAIRG